MFWLAIVLLAGGLGLVLGAILLWNASFNKEAEKFQTTGLTAIAIEAPVRGLCAILQPPPLIMAISGVVSLVAGGIIMLLMFL